MRRIRDTNQAPRIRHIMFCIIGVLGVVSLLLVHLSLEMQSRANVPTDTARRKHILVTAHEHGSIEASLRRALAQAARAKHGAIVLIPSGGYSIELTRTSEPLQIPANTELVGNARGTTLDLVGRIQGANAYRGVFNTNGDNVTIRNVAVRRVDALAGTLVHACACAGLKLDRLYLDGNADLESIARFNLIQAPARGSISDVTISQTQVTGFNYGWLQQNSSTAVVRQISVTRSTFSDMSATALEFNSPSGATEYVHITQSRFVGATNSSSSSGWGIGLANAAHVQISRNHFLSFSGEAIHAEDYSRSISISSNSFQDCAAARAACIYGLTNISALIIENNSFRTTSAARSSTYVNIWAGGVTPPSSSIRSVRWVPNGWRLVISPTPIVLRRGLQITDSAGSSFTVAQDAPVGSTALDVTSGTGRPAEGPIGQLQLTASGRKLNFMPRNITILANTFDSVENVAAAIYLKGTSGAEVRCNLFASNGDPGKGLVVQNSSVATSHNRTVGPVVQYINVSSPGSQS